MNAYDFHSRWREYKNLKKQTGLLELPWNIPLTFNMTLCVVFPMTVTCILIFYIYKYVIILYYIALFVYASLETGYICTENLTILNTFTFAFSCINILIYRYPWPCIHWLPTREINFYYCTQYSEKTRAMRYSRCLSFKSTGHACIFLVTNLTMTSDSYIQYKYCQNTWSQKFV